MGCRGHEGCRPAATTCLRPLHRPLLLSALCLLGCGACGVVGTGTAGNASSNANVEVPGGSASYYLSIPQASWSEPGEIGPIIGAYVPAYLLEARDSDGGQSPPAFLGALADDNGRRIQDMCEATIFFEDGPVAISDASTFFAGPAVFPATINGLDIGLYDTRITATFRSDGTELDVVSFAGVLLAAEFIEFFMLDTAAEVCQHLSEHDVECDACPPGLGEHCLPVKAEHFTIEQVPGVSLVQIGESDLRDGCVNESEPDDPGTDVPSTDDSLAEAVDCAIADKLEIFDKGAVYNGYTLIGPVNSNTVFLVDICGNVVHAWRTNYRTSQGVYLREDGSIAQAGDDWRDNTFRGGGKGGVVEIINWDSSVAATIDYCDSTHCHHHDVEPTPSGSIMLAAWEQYNGITMDEIVEIEPSTGSVLWRWRAGDHQREIGGTPYRDWNHTNAIDLNLETGYVLASMKNLDSVLVIDPATDDIVWQWGSGKLDGQHGAKWVPAGYPGAGNITIFDNGNNRVVEVKPNFTNNSGSIVWRYDVGDAPSTMSGAQRLINGNTIVTVSSGDVYEVTPDGNVVWHYNLGQTIFSATRYAPEFPGIADNL